MPDDNRPVGPFRKFLTSFVLLFSAILAALYVYLAARLVSGGLARAALAVPFLLVWLVPAVYWSRDREHHSRFDDWLHAGSYVSMGWLNFAVVFALLRDAAQAAAGLRPEWSDAHAVLAAQGEIRC